MHSQEGDQPLGKCQLLVLVGGRSAEQTCEKTRQRRPQGSKVAAESMWDLNWTRGGAGQGHLIRAGTLASRESPGKETALGSSCSPASKRKEIFPEKNLSNGTNRKWHQIGREVGSLKLREGICGKLGGRPDWRARTRTKVEQGEQREG